MFERQGMSTEFGPGAVFQLGIPPPSGNQRPNAVAAKYVDAELSSRNFKTKKYLPPSASQLFIARLKRQSAADVLEAKSSPRDAAHPPRPSAPGLGGWQLRT